MSSADTPSNLAPAPASPADASVRVPTMHQFEYKATDNFVEVLDRIDGCVMISTYQAGRVIVVGRGEEQAGRRELMLSLHGFDQAMGIAAAPDRIAIGSASQIWLMQSQPSFAGRLEPPGRHDACFVTRLSHVTGEISIHELAWCGRELWYVNTLFSCLCSLDPLHSFLPRWKPPFISRLAAEDRCHLNGLAVADGVPRYASALGEVDTKGGWREDKANGGCLIDITSNAVVARGFALPHSPRLHHGRLWLLDSGRGRLLNVDPRTGRSDVVAELPGYPRGLAFAGPFALVGLSRTRPGRGFEGMPLAERRHDLTAGLAVVDLAGGRTVALLEFTAGVHETFDVRFLPGVRFPALCGPFASRDSGQPIWIVPEAWMK